MSIPESALTSVYNFDRVADDYEATRYMPARIAERIAQQMTHGIAGDDWVLEAGIGTGRIGRALLRQHPRTVGIDISQKMVRYLMRAYGDTASPPSLALADIRALPFRDQTFHTAVAVHVLHLIPDWQRALSEIWRVLRVGGRLVLGVEDRTTSAVRNYFFTRAAERNALPAAGSGAHSAQVIATLKQRGITVEERRLPALRWTHPVTAAETLAQLEKRTYSILWQMSDADLRSLVEETRRWAIKEYGTADLDSVVETINYQMVLFFALRQKQSL